MITSFRSRALRRFWEKGDVSRLRPEWVARVQRQLDLLDEAFSAEDMDVPTFGFHALKGDKKGRFAITVSRNWRLTFSFDGQDAVDIDLEDYQTWRTTMGSRDPNRPPTHPGAILREDVLPGLNMSVTEAARRMRITRQALHRILAETASVTPEMALRIGKFCGNGPGVWLRLQAAHDLWHVGRRMADEIAAIEPPQAA